MSLFGAISIAGTGISANQTWLDTISSNIANVNDTANPASPIYQEQQTLVSPSHSQQCGDQDHGHLLARGKALREPLKARLDLDYVVLD